MGLRAGLAAAAGLALLGGALLLHSRPGDGDGGGSAPGPAPSGPVGGGPLLEPRVVTLVPGVHLLGLTSPNAAYLVETSDGLLLVDTCQEPDAGPILRQAGMLGLDIHRLRTILLTHAHADHSQGAQRLREMTGAKVCAGQGDAAVLRAGGPPEALFSVFDMHLPAHPTDVDVTFAGGETLRAGDVEVRVLATPGHTPGSVCYLAVKDGRRILFTGDVVMSLTDRFPLTGPGIYSAALAPRFRGDAEAFRASLETLRALPVPDLVLPGHPRNDPKPESPRLAAWWWERLLQGGIERLDGIRERLRRDGADFLDGTPRALAEGAWYLGDREGTAVYLAEGEGGGLWLVNAPGREGLAGFVKDRMEALGLGGRRIAVVLLTSCTDAGMAGLAQVAAAGRAAAAPRGGPGAAAALCPAGTEVLPAEEFAGPPPRPVRVLVPAGAGAPCAAYLLERGGRRVLLSGDLPDPVTIEPEGDDLRWGAPTPTAPLEALRTVEALEASPPDLWLPLRPRGCPNANLYDADWLRILNHNRACLDRFASPGAPPR